MLADTPVGKAAQTWLEERGFHTRAPPALMFAMWAHSVPGAMDIMDDVSYDPLHCFFVGLLPYFLDAVVLAILNSHVSTQKGYDAICIFEARLSALPSFCTGYRLFRCYPGGCVRRAINSGNDAFFLLLLFAAAIGFDDKVIAKATVRVLVLAAIEAASILAFLLRAEALTPAGREAAYVAARRFLELLLHDEFRKRQKSEWAIFKFHMLLHLINWLSAGRGAPACINSSAFEAALKLFVSSIAARSSSHQDLQRDIATNATTLAVTDLLRGAGGKAAEVLSGAARVAVNRQTLDTSNRCREEFVKAASRPAADVLGAVAADWEAAAADLGVAPGSSASIAPRAQWSQYARLARPERRFVAPVGLGAIVALGPRRRADAPDAPAIEDDPARARLGRIVSYFYLPPPAEGSPADGLPVGKPAAPAKLIAERMFAVVWPLAGQASADADKLGGNGMQFSAIRRPAPRVAGGGGAAAVATRPPLQVFPLSQVLCAVNVRPAEWTEAPYVLGPSAMSLEERACAHRKELAACRGLGQPVLVFFPPIRDTWLPPAGGAAAVPPPVQPEGANEVPEVELEEGEEDEEEE